MHYLSFSSFIFLFCLWAIDSHAAGNKRNTVPQAPANDVDHLARMDMAAEVPHPIEKYRYVVKGETAGVVFHPTAVPLWAYSAGRYQIGEIPVGTEVVPAYIKAVSGRNFFGWKRAEAEAGTGIKRTVWVDGRFLKVDGVK